MQKQKQEYTPIIKPIEKALIEKGLKDSIKKDELQLANIKNAISHFVNIDSNQQFLPDDHNKSQRDHLSRLLTASLVLETSFTYLQYITAFAGLMALVGYGEAALTLAVIGTIVDFVVNVWCVSVANDADAVSLQKLESLSPLMDRIISPINRASDISYLVGGAGNAIGILIMMAPLYEYNALLFYTIALPLLGFISYIGKVYYEAFNRKRLVETLKALNTYASTEKADHDSYRETAIAIFAFCVIAFRSISFGGIAIIVLQALKIDNPFINFIIGIIVTGLTAINVAATRLKVIVDYWSNNNFASLTDEEKKAAWDAFTFSDIGKILFNSITLESLGMAVGFPCLSNFNGSIATDLLASVGVLLAYSVFMAQIRREINVKALQNREQNSINIEAELPENVVINPMQDNDIEAPLIINEPNSLSNKINAANIAYEALKQPYSQSLLITCFAGVCSLISDATRGLGFLTYINILNSMLDVAVTIPVSKIQIIGLALIVGLPNLRNMYNMFYTNMVDNISQKAVEADITISNSSAATYFSKVKLYTCTLFTKGGLSYSVSDTRNHLMKTREKLERSINENTLKLYSSNISL